MNFFFRLFFVMPLGLKSRIKIFIYRFFGMKIGKKNRFEGGKCRALNTIVIGNNNAFFGGGYALWPVLENENNNIKILIKNDSMFNRNFFIDACGYVEIGNGCMIGPDVYITDSNHQYQFGISPRLLPMNIGKVIIGDNCWIGAKSIILKNVELGENCVVAAGSVVTKSFPPGCIVAGVPAKLIKMTS